MAERALKRRRLSHDPEPKKLELPSATDDIEEDQSSIPSEQLDDLEEEDSDGSEDGDSIDQEDDSVSSVSEDGESKQRAKVPQKRSQTSAGTYTGDANLFNLQASEMLKQITPSYGPREAPAESVLRSLKAAIEAIPSAEPQPANTVAEQLMRAQKIAVPATSPYLSVRNFTHPFSYQKPSSVNVVGSYAMRTAVRHAGWLTLDMVVTMPSSIFTDKDFRDYRYLRKRVLYLASLAAGLESAKLEDVKLSYGLLNGNALLPILVAEPKATSTDFSKSQCKINIIPTAPEGLFPLTKTLPAKACIRDTNSDDQKPTPFYNASLRSNLSVTAYLKVLHRAGVLCPAFKEACMLGRVWLRQRGFESSIQSGGFGNFEFSTFLALLLQGGGAGGKPIFAATYNSQQLLKAAINLLAQRDLSKQPLLLDAELADLPKSKLGVPYLYDGLRGLNVLHKMTASSYRMLRLQAQLTLKVFRRNQDDAFEKLFILKESDPTLRYDLLVKVNPSENSTVDRLEFAHQADETFRRGFGDRVHFVYAWQDEITNWPLGKMKPKDISRAISIGIGLNASNASRTVDRGPPAEEKSAAEIFAAFWGDKAELRRFKDGSIMHSVVWASKDPISLSKEISSYLILRHGMRLADGEESFLSNNQSSVPGDEITMDPSTNIVASFESLDKDLRALPDLPLSIRQISPADSLLSSSEDKMNRRIADVVLQFEGSGRWPDNLTAIQMTKTAFLLKLSTLLTASHRQLETSVGVENEATQFMNRSFLDVTYPSSVTFRIRIYHDRETTLLQRLLASPTTSASTRTAAAAALADQKRSYVRRPLHTQSVKSLVTRHPAFPATVRLVKRWFAAHLLSPHFSDPLLELITAQTFVEPEPWLVPASPQTGFLRTLLFLSRWDWAQTPLIVNLSAGSPGAPAQLDADELRATHTRFAAWRRLDPQLNRVALFVASNIDPDGDTWTDAGRPSKILAARMSALAKAAVQLARNKGLALDLAALFKPRLADYDFVIHIAPKFWTAQDGVKTKKQVFKNLALASDLDAARPGVASEFLRELQALYAEAVIFFADARRGTVVAGLWSPTATGARRWKVNLGYSTLLNVSASGDRDGDVHGEAGDGQLQATINKNAILAEIARLGGDIVERIDVREK